MKESTKMVKNQEKVDFFFLICFIINITLFLKKYKCIFKKVFIFTKMEINTKVSGKMIREMVLVHYIF